MLRAAFITGLLNGVISCGVAAASCTTAPRDISPFGAHSVAHKEAKLTDRVMAQLPNITRLEGVLKPVAGLDHIVVFYDTTTDDSDPGPMAALIDHGRLRQTISLAEVTNGQGGFTRFLSACAFRWASGPETVAVAVSNGFDGAATDFAIVKIAASGLKALGTAHGQQARLEIGTTGFSVSSAHSINPCVWCPHKYRRQSYRFEGRRLVRSRRSVILGIHDPDSYSSRSVVLRTNPR